MSYLGLDIGGSKCRFEWCSDGGAADAAGGDLPLPERTGEGLAAAVRAACGDARPAAVVCAVTGVGDAARRARLEGELRDLGVDLPVAIVGDVLAAAAAGLRDGPGVLLWSGTGSFAVARGDDGGLERVGGRGFAFGDEGSGFDLVRRAIVAVLRAVDGRSRETVLAETLTKAFDAPSPERLGAVAQAMTPGEVARRLPVVLDAFAQDDWVAADVLQDGMQQLVALAQAALRKVSLAAGPGARVACGGGVLVHNDVVREGLVRMLQASFGGELHVRTLGEHDAAHGAAWLARGWHRGESPQQQWVQRVAL